MNALDEVFRCDESVLHGPRTSPCPEGITASNIEVVVVALACVIATGKRSAGHP